MSGAGVGHLYAKPETSWTAARISDIDRCGFSQKALALGVRRMGAHYSRDIDAATKKQMARTLFTQIGGQTRLNRHMAILAGAPGGFIVRIIFAVCPLLISI